MMRLICCLMILCGLATPAFAQIGEARIGVNGLTCSQCTRSVEVKLRQLPFVSDVSMDLANTSGVVSLKPGVRFRPEAIAKAIKDAGFSVRYVGLVLQHPDKFISNETCLNVDGLPIALSGSVPSAASGSWLLQLQGAPFGDRRKKAAAPYRSLCGAKAIPAVATAE